MADMTDLLLHVCCAPCCTHPHRLLAGQGWTPTLFFYNPNVHPRREHDLRRDETVRYARAAGLPLLVDESGAAAFDEATAGRAADPEGGERCGLCFGLRLDRTAREARERGVPAFTTTLSVSPHKSFAAIERAGRAAAERHGVSFLAADFKKRNGFQLSVALSREHGLYRQDYCGCRHSLARRRERSRAE